MNLLLGCNRVERSELTGHVCLRHKPEMPDARDFRWSQAELLTGTLPTIGSESYDLRDDPAYISQRLRQRFSSCVGHSVRRASMLCAALVQGVTISSVSPLAPYTIARLLGDPPKKPGEPRLTDWGCGVRYALNGSHELGLPPEELWPETDENVNAVPDAGSFKAGERIRIESFHRIADGPSASAEMKAAGRRLRAPIVCMVVDQKFADIGKGVYDGPGGERLGGHAMVCVAYSEALRAFCLDNWWSTDVGDDGYFWISEDVMNARTYDKWVIDAVPVIS